jgi:hypothetical protein
MIPSKAYAELASKLIDYGAVEAGAGPEVNPKARGRRRERSRHSFLPR